MNIVSNIAKNTLYQTASKFIGTILGLITIGIMTRYLGQTGYGYYTTTIAFLQFFGVLADFGLQMTTNQMLSRPGADQQKIFNNIFSIRIIASILFLGSATLLGWLMPYPLIIKQAITITSLSFFFISLQSIFVAVFQKNMNMAKVAIAEIWGRIALLIGVWLVTIYSKNILYIMSAVVIGNFVSFVIILVSAIKYIKPKFDFDFKLWQKIWRRAWPLAITIVLTLVYFRADTIIMSWFRPQNEVGIYGASYKVLEVLVQFPYLFLGLILPLLTKFFVINKNIFFSIVQKTFDFLMIITMPMVISIIILGNKIMTFVAGNEFYISGDLLKILIIATAMIYLAAFFGYIIVACELQKKMIKFYIFDAIVSVILYLTFIPIYSYWAAAILTILTEVIIAASAFYILKKHINLSLNFKATQKALIASLLMGVVLFLLIDQSLATLIIIGSIVYFWALYMMRGISKQNVLEIIKYKN